MTDMSSEDFTIVLGSPESDHLRLRVLRRTHADCADYWDGNWLSCLIEVRAGSFSGSRKTSGAGLRGTRGALTRSHRPKALVQRATPS